MNLRKGKPGNINSVKLIKWKKKGEAQTRDRLQPKIPQSIGENESKNLRF